MAKDANNPAPKRKSNVGTKAKAALKDAQSRYRKKMLEVRKMETPNALINAGTAALGSVPVGIACGLVPDQWSVDVMGKKYDVPTGVIAEGTVTAVSLLGTVGSAFAGFVPGIHFFGGATGTGTAFLVARGVNWAREEAMKAWDNNSAQPEAPRLAA